MTDSKAVEIATALLSLAMTLINAEELCCVLYSAVPATEKVNICAANLPILREKERTGSCSLCRIRSPLRPKRRFSIC